MVRSRRAHPPPDRFAQDMRDLQLAWARGGGVPAEALEKRNGEMSWVLRPEHRKRNLFREEWWGYIAGAEHRWARALNSSQCFAVNIFAPLKDDPALARGVLPLLLPSRRLEAGDTVNVDLEFTPAGAAGWLGERGQPTQVDVYFGVARGERSLGHVLVEVKFTETGFGSCRGWKAVPARNPDPSRCLDVSAVLSAPETRCWLAEKEGRNYWTMISRSDSTLREDRIRAVGACPFRHGLYQMMRNRVLADELVRRSGAEWAEFAVCRHPSNRSVAQLDEAVSSSRDAFAAFRSLSSGEAVRDWDAEMIVRTIGAADERLGEWQAWMLGRYFAKRAQPAPFIPY